MEGIVYNSFRCGTTSWVVLVTMGTTRGANFTTILAAREGQLEQQTALFVS